LTAFVGIGIFHIWFGHRPTPSGRCSDVHYW
jgi:hypothetical protein